MNGIGLLKRPLLNNKKARFGGLFYWLVIPAPWQQGAALTNQGVKMTNLSGVPGEIRFTVEVKRAATGKIETFDMVGHPDPEVLQQILDKEQEHGRNTLNDRA